MPGVITWSGLAEGDAAGIALPGVCTWGAVAGEGDAAGICMPGVITCGAGEGTTLGLAFIGVRLARLAGRFFLGFGFGLAAGFILDMSCPSCCGNALTLSANIKASALTALSAIFKLLGRFIIPLN